jgi:hypothetical protein
MIFKKVTMEYASFDLENLPDLKAMLDDNCEKCDGPISDLSNKPKRGQSEYNKPQNQKQTSARGGKGAKRRD